MFEMCFSTAPGVTTSASAIAQLVWPSAISESTSPSRGESGAQRIVGAAGARLPTSSETTSRSSAVPPPATRRIASRKAGMSPTRSFSRYPTPPSPPARSSAAPTGSTYWERISTPRSGWRQAGLDRGADPLVGEARRQPHVDDRQVPLVAADDPQQPLAVPGWATTSKSALAQQRDQPLAQQQRVLGDHDPHGSTAAIRN